MQFAHAFLGLRLQCAQCHRHPYDVWQQDDLLSFANLFTAVNTGGSRKNSPEVEAYTDAVGNSCQMLRTPVNRPQIVRKNRIFIDRDSP